MQERHHAKARTFTCGNTLFFFLLNHSPTHPLAHSLTHSATPTRTATSVLSFHAHTSTPKSAKSWHLPHGDDTQRRQDVTTTTSVLPPPPREDTTFGWLRLQQQSARRAAVATTRKRGSMLSSSRSRTTSCWLEPASNLACMSFNLARTDWPMLAFRAVDPTASGD